MESSQDKDVASFGRRKRARKLEVVSSNAAIGDPTAKSLSGFLKTVKKVPSYQPGEHSVGRKEENEKQKGHDGGKKRCIFSHRGSRTTRTSKRVAGSVQAVRWPGMDDHPWSQEHEEDLSDIEGYSDSSSRSSTAAPSPPQEERKEASPAPPLALSPRQLRPSLSKYVSSVWRPMDTSEHHSTAEMDDAIADYDSSPSPDGSHQSPHLHIHEPYRRRRSTNPAATLRSFSLRTKAPPGEENISSASSSSPEMEAAVRSHLKTSDWLKQSVHETPASVDMSVSSLSESLLLSSGPGRRGGRRGRRMKFVAGGLAEQLQRVIQSEAADVAFWEHRLKGKEQIKVEGPCIDVEVMKLSSVCSLLLASCKVLEGKELLTNTADFSQLRNEEEEEEEEKETMIYFDIGTARQLCLTVGCIVRIHSPWQKLVLANDSAHSPTHQSPVVLLCTQHSELLGHVTRTTPNQSSAMWSPGPVKIRAPSCQFSDTIVSPPSAMLTRSPQKSMQPSRLFTMSSPKDSPATFQSPPGCPLSPLPPAPPTPLPPSSALGLLEALEQQRRDSVSFTATVKAIYRRPTCTSAFSSFSSALRNRHITDNVVCRWVLLLSDDDGVCSELVIEQEHITNWRDIVRNGEGMKLELSGLKVVRRTTSSCDPELFSLIRFFSSPLLSSLQETDARKQLPQFLYCYVCHTQQCSVYKICSSDHAPLSGGSTHKIDAAESADVHVGGAKTEALVSETQPQFVDLIGRILFIHPNPGCGEGETSQAFKMPPFVSSGYTLFLVIPASVAGGNHNTISHTHTGQLVKVYVKPKFPIIGLLSVLTTPGVPVLLKNASLTTCNYLTGRMEQTTQQYPSYVIGAYSLLTPFDHTLLQDEVVWPCLLHREEKLKILLSLSPPQCPKMNYTNKEIEPGSLFHIEGVVKGVDHSTAYSWLECNICGQGDLVVKETTESSQSGIEKNLSQTTYTCENCHTTVHDPVTRIELAVLLSSPNHPEWEFHVQLLQRTALSLLPASAGNFEEGFDLNCVLQRHLSLPACFLTRKSVTQDGSSMMMYLIEVDTQWLKD